MDKLKAIETFVAIAQYGSLTEASLRIGKSLPTVVRTLAALEDHLDARLFNRTTRRVELTDEGRNYLEHCKRLIADLNQAERDISGEAASPSGMVTLTAPLCFGERHVAPALCELLSRHAGLRVRLTLADRILDLIEHHVDIAIRIGHLRDSTLRMRKIGEVRQVLCATPALLEKTGGIRSPADLARLPCVVNEGNNASTSWPFRTETGVVSVPVNAVFHTNTVASAARACRAHAGYAMFLSYQVADEIRSGELVRLLAEHEPPPLPVNLVHAATPFVPARMRVTLDELAEMLAARIECPGNPGRNGQLPM